MHGPLCPRGRLRPARARRDQPHLANPFEMKDVIGLELAYARLQNHAKEAGIRASTTRAGVFTGGCIERLSPGVTQTRCGILPRTAPSGVERPTTPCAPPRDCRRRTSTSVATTRLAPRTRPRSWWTPRTPTICWRGPTTTT